MNVFHPQTKTNDGAHYSEAPRLEWIGNIAGLHTFFVCGKPMRHQFPTLFLNRPIGCVIVRKTNHDNQTAEHVTDYEMGQILGGN